MKRLYLFMVLCLCVVLSGLAGCAGQQPAPDASPGVEQTPVSTPTQPCSTPAPTPVPTPTPPPVDYVAEGEKFAVWVYVDGQAEVHFWQTPNLWADTAAPGSDEQAGREALLKALEQPRPLPDIGPFTDVFAVPPAAGSKVDEPMAVAATQEWAYFLIDVVGDTQGTRVIAPLPAVDGMQGLTGFCFGTSSADRGVLYALSATGVKIKVWQRP
nr:hypothetical protein [bacterium]